MTYYSFFSHCLLTKSKEAFYTVLLNTFVFITSHIAIATFVTVVAYGFEPEDKYEQGLRRDATLSRAGFSSACRQDEK